MRPLVRRLATALPAVIAVAWVVLLTVRGHDPVVSLGSALLVVGVGGAAAGACWLRGRACGGTDGRVWSSVAAAAAVAAALRAAALIDLPVAAGALGLATGAVVVLTGIGLAVLRPTASSRPQRLRAAIDGALAGGAVLVIASAAGARPTSAAHAIAAVGAGVVVGLAARAASAEGLAVRSAAQGAAEDERGPLAVLLAGAGALAMAAAVVVAAPGAAVAAPGAHLDAGWGLAGLLLIVAARRGGGLPLVVRDDVPVPSRAIGSVPPEPQELPAAGVVLPSASLAVAATAMLIAGIIGTADIVGIGVLSVSAVLILVRGVLVHRESSAVLDALHARAAGLAESEQRLMGLVRHSSDVVTLLDPDGTVRFQSDSVERVLGHRAGSMRGRSLGWLLDSAGTDLLARTLRQLEDQPLATTAIDLTVRDAEGRPRPLEVAITNLIGQEGVDGYVLSMRDVSEQRALQQQLVHEAGHDALTALANRTRFTDRLEGALERAAVTGRGLAVLFLDLDGFKMINDTMGHAAGDALLVHAAQRLRRCVRPGDTIARLGGDEFAVLVEDGSDPEVAIAVADRIGHQLRSPFAIAGRTVQVSASVGIATAEPGRSSSQEVLRNADLAMYRAKAESKGGWELFDDEMHDALVQQVQLETELASALERHEFVLHYQPTFDISTGRLSGVEALVRWQHPTRGLLGPGAFIGEAERTGLILELGTWVLQQACRQAVSWHRQLDGLPLTMAVNVSGLQLDVSFPDTVAEILRLTEMPAEHLVLEMTESMLIDSNESVDVLSRLKDLGVGLAIDDFGTGYSSLSYLHRYPVDVLKIDRSFVSRMRQSEDALAMVEAVLQLARSLGLSTVAEGIEEPADIDVLRSLGCDKAQGYLLGKPMEALGINELLGLHRSDIDPIGRPTVAA